MDSLLRYYKSPRKLRRATLGTYALTKKVFRVPEDADVCCGISYLWSTGPNDPFISACAWHDLKYSEDPKVRTQTRLEVDQIFLGRMLTIAGRDEELIAKAYMFYSIVRSVGWLWW